MNNIINNLKNAILEAEGKTEKQIIAEGGLSRIQQAISDKNQKFAIVSAYRNENTKSENNEATKNLLSDIIELGYKGFIKMEGGYIETKENGDTIPVWERSFFVRDMSLEDAIMLCKKYNQDSILYKDENGMRYVDKNGNSDMEFLANQDNTLLVDNNYSVSKIGNYFSRRLQGGNKRNAFAFKPNECYLAIAGWKWGKNTIAEYYDKEKSDKYIRIL